MRVSDSLNALTDPLATSCVNNLALTVPQCSNYIFRPLPCDVVLLVPDRRRRYGCGHIVVDRKPFSRPPFFSSYWRPSFGYDPANSKPLHYTLSDDSTLSCLIFVTPQPDLGFLSSLWLVCGAIFKWHFYPHLFKRPAFPNVYWATPFRLFFNEIRLLVYKCGVGRNHCIR